MKKNIFTRNVDLKGYVTWATLFDCIQVMYY